MQGRERSEAPEGCFCVKALPCWLLALPSHCVTHCRLPSMVLCQLTFLMYHPALPVFKSSSLSGTTIILNVATCKLIACNAQHSALHILTASTVARVGMVRMSRKKL